MTMTYKDLQKESKKYEAMAEQSSSDGLPGNASEEYLLKAFEYARQAYILYNAHEQDEKIKIQLIQSAIRSALKAKLYREAEKLNAMAMAEDYDEETISTFRQLNHDIELARHLSQHHLQLNANEVLLSLSGAVVGNGVVRGYEVMDRVDGLSKLAFRTADRLRQRPFNEKAKPSKTEVGEFETYLTTVPGEVFSLKVGFGLSNKGSFPTLDSQPFLIEDMMKNIALVNNNDYPSLTKSIPDEAYRNNFIALTKRLSPDGHLISSVGLSTSWNDKQSNCLLSRTKSSYQSENKTSKIEDEQTPKPIEIIGTLYFADSKKRKIKLFDEYSGHEYLIEVPKGLLSDVVKPYFEEEVKVKGMLQHKVIHLSEIDKVII